MKLPLKLGIPLLVVLLLGSGYATYGQGKSLFLMLAMGVAMWTAFSLPRPRKWRPEELEDDGLEDALDESAPTPPANGSGSGRPPGTGPLGGAS